MSTPQAMLENPTANPTDAKSSTAKEPVRYKLDGEFAGLDSATIMMVDDESITMEVVKTFLEDAGYRNFVLLDDSTQAMQMLRDQRPDVLLLDLMMPEVSGFDILSMIRADDSFTHLPVIILTSSSDAETKLNALDLGATDFLAKPVDSSELALRVRNTLAAKAYQDQLAYYDRLTNLPNAQLFHDRATWAIEKAKRESHRAAMLHISFNNFRSLNATLGPRVGDQILVTLAKRMEHFVRSSDIITRHTADTGPMGDVFRLGGAEFSILLPAIQDNLNLTAISHRLITAVETPMLIENNEIKLKPHIGASIFPDDAQDAQQLQKCALTASTQARDAGSYQLHFYSAEMNQAALRRLQMESDLRNALGNNDFHIFYQPKVDVSSGRITGAEALIRWIHNGESISPEEFIPIAESTGTILPIGEWMLNQACQQIARWHSAGHKLKVAVNVSAKQLFEIDLIDAVRQAIQDADINPRYLTLEMTESLLIEDMLSAAEKMSALRALGVSISMDDFGTGYSSLSYLKKLPLDEVKIDRAFIMDSVNCKKDQALVSAIIFLAHQFGFSVCAEGIEHPEQLAFLQSAKCDVYQGYFFSRPIDAIGFNRLLEENAGID